jgi:hypothetical protein
MLHLPAFFQQIQKVRPSSLVTIELQGVNLVGRKVTYLAVPTPSHEVMTMFKDLAFGRNLPTKSYLLHYLTV